MQSEEVLSCHLNDWLRLKYVQKRLKAEFWYVHKIFACILNPYKLNNRPRFLQTSQVRNHGYIFFVTCFNSNVPHRNTVLNFLYFY